jgi:ubiquinone/menaquinone biosynthesis C-methylase UbiE
LGDIPHAAAPPKLGDSPEAECPAFGLASFAQLETTNTNEEIVMAQTLADRKQPALDTPENVQDAWDSIADGYDAHVTPSNFRLGTEGLRLAGLRSGMRFLDVAAGSGALSIPAARLGAQVLATDVSPVMLERLAARARDEGLELETRVMDGHALELEDNLFDVSGSQFGVMLFPDMPRGVRELARVTKPGGRVLMTVFGPPQQVEFLGFFVKAVQSVIPDFTGLPMDPPPLPFQLQDPERLRRELSGAGLTDVRVERTKEKRGFRSGNELWNWLTSSNPIVGIVLAQLDLSGEQQAAVADALEDMVRARSGGSRPAVLTSPINIGIGTK